MHHLLALSLLSSQPATTHEHHLFDLPARLRWDDGDAGENPWWRPPPRFDPHILMDCDLLRWGGGGAPSPWPPAILKPDPPPFRVLRRFTCKTSHNTQYARTAWDPPRSYSAFAYHRRGQHMTAHRSLPLGSLLLILRHGKVDWAIVSDRGPFGTPGRDLDVGDPISDHLGIEDDDRHGHVVTALVLRLGPGHTPADDSAFLRRAARWVRSNPTRLP